MFEIALFAILLIVLAFGALLYFGGAI